MVSMAKEPLLISLCMLSLMITAVFPSALTFVVVVLFIFTALLIFETPILSTILLFILVTISFYKNINLIVPITLIAIILIVGIIEQKLSIYKDKKVIYEFNNGNYNKVINKYVYINKLNMPSGYVSLNRNTGEIIKNENIEEMCYCYKTQILENSGVTPLVTFIHDNKVHYVIKESECDTLRAFIKKNPMSIGEYLYNK